MAAKATKTTKTTIVSDDSSDDPIKLEAREVDTREVEHRGIAFSIAADVNDWPARAVLDFEQERPMSAIRALVSPEAFDKYLDTNPTVGDFATLAQRVTDAAGASGN